MSGHNKWSSIKHKKAAADEARGRLFSKLSKNISVAAKAGADPQFNPSLKNAIEQAKKSNMPQTNIERAIKRASEVGDIEELLLEIYGPGGAGVLVEVLTDSRNRSIAEIKALLKNFGSKIAEQGSLMWSFEKTAEGYNPKFETETLEENKRVIKELVEELEAREDIKAVYPSVKI